MCGGGIWRMGRNTCVCVDVYVREGAVVFSEEERVCGWICVDGGCVRV